MEYETALKICDLFLLLHNRLNRANFQYQPEKASFDEAVFS